MQQSYDDDSYYSDDFASHCDQYGLSSIHEHDGLSSIHESSPKSTLPTVKKSAPSNYYDNESKEDDSYSMDDDFTCTSRHRNEYRSASDAGGNEGIGDQDQQQGRTRQYEYEKSVDEYSMDEDFASTSGSVSLKNEVVLSSYQNHQEPYVDESKEEDECEQAVNEECKHQVDKLETNDDSENAVDHTESVSTPTQSVVQKPGPIQNNVEEEIDSCRDGADCVTVPNEELVNMPVASDISVCRKDDEEEYEQGHEDSVATPIKSSEAKQASEQPAADEYIGEVDSTVEVSMQHSQLPTSVEKKAESNCQHEEESKHPQTARCDAQTQTLAKVKEVSSQQPKTPLKRPSNFVPRCAYAQTKTMQLRKDENAETKQEEPTKVIRRYSKKRLEQLARPARHKVYNKENNIQSGSSGSNVGKSKKKNQPYDGDEDSPTDSDYGPSFLERMETMEEERQERLVRAAAEALYEARTDKHKCSNCK